MAQKKDSFFLAASAGKRNAVLRKPETFKRIEKNTSENPKENDNVETDKKIKKPFDKKAYRIKKYSKKYKLEQWEDQRRKKVLRTYYKELKNEAPLGSYKPVKFDEDSKDSDEKGVIDKNNDGKTPEDDEESSYGRFVRHPDLIDEPDTIKSIPAPVPIIAHPKIENFKSVKKSAFQRAKEEMQRLKQSKEDKRREIEKSKEEKEKKLQEYRKKKADRFKKLSRKTKKGQPVMTGRLELLLEKIVKNK